MKQYIEYDLVMLPSKEKGTSAIMVGVVPNHCVLTKDVLEDIYDWMKFGEPQHLYIISNDEIKDEEWCIIHGSMIRQYQSSVIYSVPCKKLIATTDKSLCNLRQNSYLGQAIIPLHQISQQFIEYFIKEYNKGNILTKVLVECETEEDKNRNGYCQIDCNGTQQKNTPECCRNKLSVKVNSDNTINIKPVDVKMYSGEEVKKIVLDFFYYLENMKMLKKFK